MPLSNGDEVVVGAGRTDKQQEIVNLALEQDLAVGLDVKDPEQVKSAAQATVGILALSTRSSTTSDTATSAPSK